MPNRSSRSRSTVPPAPIEPPTVPRGSVRPARRCRIDRCATRRAGGQSAAAAISGQRACRRRAWPARWPARPLATAPASPAWRPLDEVVARVRTEMPSLGAPVGPAPTSTKSASGGAAVDHVCCQADDQRRAMSRAPITTCTRRHASARTQRGAPGAVAPGARPRDRRRTDRRRTPTGRPAGRSAPGLAALLAAARRRRAGRRPRDAGQPAPAREEHPGRRAVRRSPRARPDRGRSALVRATWRTTSGSSRRR